MKHKRLSILLFILLALIVIHLMNPFGLTDEEMNKLLTKAVEKGDFIQVRSLKAKGADINILNNKGETLLHLAADYGHKNTAEFLIRKGIDVNAKNKYGITALGYVVGGYRNKRELPDIKDPNYYHQRGYYFHCQNEFDRAIEDYTSAIQLNSKDESVYFWRGRAWAEKGNAEQAVEDWKQSIQLNWRNALHLYYVRRLLKSPNSELDRLIKDTAIQHLADLDIVDGYAVYYSASPGDLYTASLILSKPFEEEKFLNMAKDNNPVIRALALISLAREDITKYEKIISSFYADTAEVEYVPSGCIVSRITLDKLAKNIINDPNLLDCWAPEHTNWKYDMNDDLNEQYREQVKIELIRLLMEKGAEVNVKDIDGETPLHYAVAHGYIKTSEYLINHGAKTNIQNNSGETPLHCATFWGNKDMIELLIQNGADINKRTNAGWTSLQYAQGLNYKGLSDLLREHGATE